MKKLVKVCVVCMLCAVMLCSCGKKSDPLGENVISGNPQAVPQNLYQEDTPTQPQTENGFDYDSGEYNPAEEEATGFEDAYEQPVTQPTEHQFLTSEYAGATPVIIDPIDKPTPTPVPPLTFTYQLYEATGLHVSFEGPVGWMIDDSEQGVYVITNPNPAMDYMARAEIRAEKVATEYTAADLKNVAKSVLDSIKNSGVKSFSPSQTAERNLLDKNGVYANYTAVSPDGALIAGRIHVVEVDRTLYTVHVSYPKAYTSTYVDEVYTKIRKTLKITQ